MQKAAGAEHQPAPRIKRRAPQKAGGRVCVCMSERVVSVVLPAQSNGPNLISDFKRLFNERVRERPTLLLRIHLRTLRQPWQAKCEHPADANCPQFTAYSSSCTYGNMQAAFVYIENA